MKQTRNQASHNGSDDLSYYMHDGPTSFRFEIEGSLSGSVAMELEQSWRTASSVIGNRPLVIALGHVSRIDPCGRALLLAWHQAGAQFVAKSPLAKTLVGAILGQPVLSVMRVTKYDGWVQFGRLALRLIPVIALLCPAAVDAASLDPTTLKAWEEYVASASLRMEQRLSAGKAFLWVDEIPDRLARVRAGEIVVSPVGAQNPKRLPSGLIHDWVGAVFIANVTLKDVLQVVSDYARYKDLYPPAVVDSAVIATSEAKDRFSMLLISKSLVLKTALDIDSESCYVHVDDRRGYSVSRTTRIQEVEEYGASTQHILHEGEGHGLIWRLFSITRYVERDGGVYLELEAIGLSRDIPASLRWLVEPIVRRVSRGSLSTTLRQTEIGVHLRAAPANGNSGTGGSDAAITPGVTADKALHTAHPLR
jgi:hypothetical protein